MSQASSQAQRFYEQVIADGRVFTFLTDGRLLVFRMPAGEVVPFWSSAARLKRIQRDHAKYRDFQVDEISYTDFKARTLEQLRDEGIRVGVNWSGAGLTGFDLSVDELLNNLSHREKRATS